MNLRDGDIALVRSRWWLRWLVQFDHAALVYSRQPRLEGEARHWYTIEAGFSGVRDWRYGHWPREWVVMRPLCLPGVAYDAVSAAMTWRGDPYAWWNLPAIFRRAWSQRVETAALRVCTELVVDAYRAVGLDLCPGLPSPTPDDIRESKRLMEVKE